MKQCTRCKNLLPLNGFSKGKQYIDGLMRWCKSCRKDYNQENASHIKKYSQKYYQNNSEKCHKQSRDHYKKGSLKYKERNKKYNQQYPEYQIWYHMIRRCMDSKHVGYKNYGERGIKVCTRWLTSFNTFLIDVGRRPSVKYTIDRINNNGNYEPKNVKWSTWVQQATNRRGRKKDGSSGR